MDRETYSILWAPEAVEALAAVFSEKKQQRIVQRVSLLAAGPGLHRPRPTASWGTVYLFTERPFINVYRYHDTTCEILDVVDATFVASYEIKE